MKKGIFLIFLLLAFVPYSAVADFWGSKQSNKYHFPECEWARKINPANLIIFKTSDEAQNSGYIPCRVCRPPTTSGSGLIDHQRSSISHIEIKEFEPAYCPRVIDGDTIIVNLEGKKERVRLIGVDTPETKNPQKLVDSFGREAYLFTKKMLEGREVNLEFDWQKRDKYGRLLAYVYLPDGTFLNAEIIKQGYGFAYTRFPFKYLEEFRNYEKKAREKKIGLWMGQK